MADLLVLTGPDQGRSLPLLGDRNILGRDPKCSIVIKQTMVSRDSASGDPNSVSRKHAVILCEGDQYYIEDGDGQGTKSRNGVYINEHRVPFPGRMPLRNNDRIRICNFVCTFQEEASSFSVEESIDDASSLPAQPADKLRIILEISNSLSKTLEIDSLLPRIVEHLFQLFQQAERGFIILRDDASGELVPRVSKSRRAGDNTDGRFSACVVRQCLENMQAILGNDLARQFPESDSITALPIRSLMCAPLWTQDGRAFGAIQLDHEGPAKKFTRDDLNLLLGVASQASIALSNARLHRDALDLQRRVQDMELARQVQSSLLPHALPSVPGYEFYAYYESAQEVGGDYYDFIPLPDQRLAVLLGDVSGKGVAAALIRAKFSVEARVCLLAEPDPATAVTKLNTLMCRAELPDRFVTFAAVVLDTMAHAATLVNAGHLSPLLFRHATEAVENADTREMRGPPIGVADCHQYGVCQILLQPGDRLLLLSDGITEAMNAEGHQFGAKRAGVVFGRTDSSPRKAGERLIQAVKQHTSGCSQHDDITLVCFGRDK